MTDLPSLDVCDIPLKLPFPRSYEAHLRIVLLCIKRSSANHQLTATAVVVDDSSAPREPTKSYHLFKLILKCHSIR